MYKNYINFIDKKTIFKYNEKVKSGNERRKAYEYVFYKAFHY